MEAKPDRLALPKSTRSSAKSRACTPSPQKTRSVDEGSCLFEMLRELAFESALRVGECSLRVGLAATSWQLQQAQILLDCVQAAHPNIQAVKLDTDQRAVAVALNTGLGRDSGAMATISLRRDSESGLALDLKYPAALADLRSTGARLAEIEQLAFDTRLPLSLTLAPMLRALSSVVLDTWSSTGLLVACKSHEVAFYCDTLGFSQVFHTEPGAPDFAEVLLLLPSSQLSHWLGTTHGSTPPSLQA